jgi:hypothetical protein
MAPLPAVCESCGRLWTPDNLIGGEGRIEIADVRVGPCPHCGGMGRIPDGVYDLSRSVTRMVSGLSLSDLTSLARVIADASHIVPTHGDLNPENVLVLTNELHLIDFDQIDAGNLSRLIRDEVPAAAGVADALRTNPQALGWLLMFVLTLIQTLVALGAMPTRAPDTITPAQVEEIITRVGENLRPAAQPANVPAAPKVGRNQPCPCGSGLKFKRCHGK